MSKSDLVIKYPKSIDHNKFMTTSSTETKYGLPSEVRYCRTCTMSNQLPRSEVEHKHNSSTQKKTILIHEDGRCDACHITEKKNNEVIDWKERDQQLRDLCDKYRSRNGAYDCLVPGSGGKDSFYTAHKLKYDYGMNPLTVTWAPNMYTDWGWKNFQSWINAGFDNHLVTPNGRAHRLLTRLSVDNLLHPFQAFIIGQKSFVLKMATKMSIPLVFYGESDAEYGTGPQSRMDTPKRDLKFSTSNEEDELYFGGISYSDLIKYFGLSANDLSIYLPEKEDKIKSLDIQYHDLGYYLKWHPQNCYYYAVKHGGFIPSPERTLGTYSKYNSIDDKIDDFHYYTTGIKFGIARATYETAQEIRAGDIDREEGVALVKKFDHEYPERFADEVFNYLSISENEYPVAFKMFEQPIIDREYFDKLCDNFRSPHLWSYKDNKWVLRKIIK